MMEIKTKIGTRAALFEDTLVSKSVVVTGVVIICVSSGIPVGCFIGKGVEITRGSSAVGLVVRPMVGSVVG